MSSNANKKMVSFRLSNEDLEKLDYISKDLSEYTKINFDRTMALEYCIRWEYDRKYNTNNATEYVESLKK